MSLASLVAITATSVFVGTGFGVWWGILAGGLVGVAADRLGLLVPHASKHLGSRGGKATARKRKNG